MEKKKKKKMRSVAERNGYSGSGEVCQSGPWVERIWESGKCSNGHGKFLLDLYVQIFKDRGRFAFAS